MIENHFNRHLQVKDLQGAVFYYFRFGYPRIYTAFNIRTYEARFKIAPNERKEFALFELKASLQI